MDIAQKLCKIQGLGYKAIMINVINYTDLLKEGSLTNTDFIIDKNVLKTGLYSYFLGKPVFVTNTLDSTHFCVPNSENTPVDNKEGWSIPIKWDQIDIIDRLVKLKTFY